jgi:hypothetical protein
LEVFEPDSLADMACPLWVILLGLAEDEISWSYVASLRLMFDQADRNRFVIFVHGVNRIRKKQVDVAEKFG